MYGKHSGKKESYADRKAGKASGGVPSTNKLHATVFRLLEIDGDLSSNINRDRNGNGNGNDTRQKNVDLTTSSVLIAVVLAAKRTREGIKVETFMLMCFVRSSC